MRIKIFVPTAFQVSIGGQTVSFAEGTHSVMPAIANHYEVKLRSTVVSDVTDPALRKIEEAKIKAAGLRAAAKAEYDKRVAEADAMVTAAENAS
jgi:hypothetical protein